MARLNKFSVADEYTRGYMAGLKWNPAKQEAGQHWSAGYEDGCKARSQKTEALNQYLISIGCEPMGMLKLV